MSSALKLFVVVNGHSFSRNAFEALLSGLGEIEPTIVDQPAAAALLNPGGMKPYGAILFYDMPGLDFYAARDERPRLIDPPVEFKRGFEALLASGKGIVALHHAIAAWPAWPYYADALGGIFLYKDMAVRGHPRPSSFYLADAEYRVRLCDTTHPVLGGLPAEFDLSDELYAYEYFGEGVVLLERSSNLDPSRFKSAMRTVRREQDRPDEVPDVGALCTPLVWAKSAQASPVVYIQPGDKSSTYENVHFRKLLGNAVRWVASDEARAWAAARSSRPTRPARST